MAGKFNKRRRTAGKIRMWIGCILIAVAIIGLVIVGGHMLTPQQENDGVQMESQSTNATQPSSSIPASDIWQRRAASWNLPCR